MDIVNKVVEVRRSTAQVSDEASHDQMEWLLNFLSNLIVLYIPSSRGFPFMVPAYDSGCLRTYISQVSLRDLH